MEVRRYSGRVVADLASLPLEVWGAGELGGDAVVDGVGVVVSVGVGVAEMGDAVTAAAMAGAG